MGWHIGDSAGKRNCWLFFGLDVICSGCFREYGLCCQPLAPFRQGESIIGRNHIQTRPVFIGNASTGYRHWQENVMMDVDQAKSMAKQLRAALATECTEVSHGRALELIAKTLGFRDWNTASASLGNRNDTAVQFTECNPILRIFDEGKAREFYCGFLGFNVTFEHRFEPGLPLYLGLERDGLHLHLSEHHGDASPGSNMFVVTKNIRAFHAELIGKHYSYNRPGLEELPWGLQMQVHDPFGNRIRFCQQDD
jgi:catechol 2,3-dioxygenase-like lactoylglutathione lyase family enzyme